MWPHQWTESGGVWSSRQPSLIDSNLHATILRPNTNPAMISGRNRQWRAALGWTPTDPWPSSRVVARNRRIRPTTIVTARHHRLPVAIVTFNTVAMTSARKTNRTLCCRKVTDRTWTGRTWSIWRSCWHQSDSSSIIIWLNETSTSSKISSGQRPSMTCAPRCWGRPDRTVEDDSMSTRREWDTWNKIRQSPSSWSCSRWVSAMERQWTWTSPYQESSIEKHWRTEPMLWNPLPPMSPSIWWLPKVLSSQWKLLLMISHHWLEKNGSMMW